MAIAPLSDIVLDVAGAADPVKRREAAEKLARLAGTPSAAAPAFADVLGTHNVAQPALPAGLPGRNQLGLMAGHSADSAKVYQKFEAVFLQNFVESMLPKDDDIFGDSASAGISRSMMAEQLAQQIAKTGKLGIASKILAAHPPVGGHQPAAGAAEMVPALGHTPSTPVKPEPPSTEIMSDRVSSTSS